MAGQKLTDRVEITAGLTLNDLQHLVNGGASWKVKLSTLINFFFGPGQSLNITYTGQPIAALVFPLCPGCAVVPSAVVVGQANYPAVSGPCITRLNYTENSLAFGPRLTALSFDDLVGCTGSFSINSLTAITSFSAPNLVFIAVSFAPTNAPLLTTLSFPKLAWVNDSFQPTTFAALTTLSFPELVSVGISFSPQTMALLTTFSFPKLAYVGGGFSPAAMAALVSISLPSLKTVMGAFSISSMAALTTVDLSAMAIYGSTIAMNTSNGNISSVILGTIGTLKSINGATINISSQKLPSANVNAILALLVSLDGTNGTTLWGAGKTLTINLGTNGAPTGQGITDKATLVARGATVTTN